VAELPDRSWFTPLLNQIAEAAGERAALKLGTEKAAQEIYIPAKVTDEHWLAKLVGLDEARAIAEVFGGRNIVLPPSIGGQKRKRADILAEMIERGYTVNKITAATGVARSTVYDHRAKHKAPPKDDPQGSLF
jgi:ABC-type proline/glycine betaine transport system substrate-binding protein